MAVEKITLVANPGSSSRKYAFYRHDKCLASLHFETDNGQIVYTLTKDNKKERVATSHTHIDEVSASLLPLARQHELLSPHDRISQVALRIVAPSGFFLEDRLLDPSVLSRLTHLRARFPLHIGASLDEYNRLKKCLPDARYIGISDSGFHKNKPDYAWNYGLPLDLADRLELKRFGYHGLSVESAIHRLRSHRLLHSKLVICHLGSGSSVSAVKNGTSIDNTMGYSPLEGVVMATRSGNVDPVAVNALQEAEGLDDEAAELLLNTQSGLLGISGVSSDIRELLKLEETGHYRASLALKMYVYTVCKAVGQMTAALDGLDSLIFTGTVGERSEIIRKRILNSLSYLGLKPCEAKSISPSITQVAHSPNLKTALVVECDEMEQMARRAALLTG